MKLERVRLLALTALLLSAPLPAQDWFGTYRISGTVTDSDNNPLEGAEVRVFLGTEDRGPKPVLTKKNGRWGFLGIRPGVWTVSVTYEGKKPSEGQFQVGLVLKPLQIRLRDIPEDLLLKERAIAADALFGEGDALLELGDTGGARARYQQGMTELDPSYHLDILLAIAHSYSSEDDTANALLTLQKAVEMAPDSPRALLQLARAHYDEGNVDHAISGLQQLLELEPDNEPALRVVTDMLVAEGRMEEAEQYLSRLPEGVKLDPNALLNAGIEHYNNNQMDEALTRFEQVVSENPEMAMGYYYRGLVYVGESRNEEAAADFRRFLEMAPDSDRAAEAGEFLSYLEPQE